MTTSKVTLLTTISIIFFMFLSGCDDPKELKKELQSAQAKLLILKAEKGNCDTENEKMKEQVNAINNALAAKDLEIAAAKKEVEDKNLEIENILKEDPAKFWIEKLQPLLTDCYNFEKEADTFVRNFSKEALNYDKVVRNLAYCQRQNKIEELTAKLNFKAARNIAKTPEELAKIQAAKDDFKKYDVLVKNIRTGNALDLYKYLGLDVVGAYNLEDRYNTPLKLQNFKASADFAAKEKILKDLSELIKKEHYRLEIKGIFDLPYNTTHRGFLIKIGKGFGFSLEDARPPYTYNGFHFPYLEYYQTPSPFGSLNPDIQELVVKVHPSIAGKIENSPKEYKLYINFYVTGINKVKYKFFNNSKDDNGGLRDTETGVVSTEKGEYELVHSKSGKKYFHLDELLEEDGI
ncbi:MAG: hypothetical protein A2504_02880 [Bdellovibrionales bacterium RIFOXYD12_FULL_39_22]|nr:MAG: hypothetical protein A2385_05595 [Bdellovibrionales bacterium RIFOXYB1_FULL_39_21]OFZ42230.1 MAG: hypothetical protein A2485_15625 [Bdellovibrionales bacterium RIFOXYC12_FULL_39_17]OFZ46678.1 MAG: hypothetical protein A2404_04045 [Bdellovibrionales bacterium RIFOXYC1_FULL_39_130]OFZ71931.1 MAG: hypothetical protein A2451_03095 [Bdellovibrionales bacterium RIFOXYC2_FULL_39_8]OFZ76045.1 MAG: hypothetical protein A2560_03105 [Bdellovibrionales bacterium RIFOXYD1_FULL_39_84]OFZ93029.1 MAG: